jgi:hypothetical protein
MSERAAVCHDIDRGSERRNPYALGGNHARRGVSRRRANPSRVHF